MLLAQELLATGDKVSLAALNKLNGHFWYLSEELIGFSFFDDSISVEDKRNIVEALAEEVEDPAKCIILSDQDLRNKVISDFVRKNTKQFFDALSISTDFLEEDPTLWSSLPSYIEAQKTVGKLRVTNDTTERRNANSGIQWAAYKIREKKHNSSSKWWPITGRNCLR